MSKVITFSRTFPAYHPRAGEPTYFVEKILEALTIENWDMEREFNPRLSLDFFDPKHHTIRAGHRWKVGDKFSPRVWSGKPYNSKMIQFAPDIEIKKIFLIDMDRSNYYIDRIEKYSKTDMLGYQNLKEIALNDGLSMDDFEAWFNEKEFQGQIICWNENINY